MSASRNKGKERASKRLIRRQVESNGVKPVNDGQGAFSQNDPQVVLDVAATLASGKVSLSRGALIIAAARCVETGELDLGSALALVGAS